MKVFPAALALVALFWSAGVIGGDFATVRIGELQVREFDEASADWRRANLRNEFFYGWNWRGSEAGGSNDDLEILIPLIGEAGAKVPQTLVVTITSRRSHKVIESRRFTGVRLPASGTAHQAIQLRDAACSGTLDVVAKLGDQEKALILGLDCGE